MINKLGIVEVRILFVSLYSYEYMFDKCLLYIYILFRGLVFYRLSGQTRFIKKYNYLKGFIRKDYENLKNWIN